MDATACSLDSVYHYLKHNVQSASIKTDLIPYIFAEFTNIKHLKEFISISLEKQYKMEKKKHSHLGNKLHSLYLSLTSKRNDSIYEHPKTKPKLSKLTPKFKSRPNLHSHTNKHTNDKIEDKYHKWLDIDAISYASSAESEYHSAQNEETDVSEEESEHEHGADFAIAGYGDTTIVYHTDTEPEHEEAHHTHIISSHFLRELSVDDIKESEPESTPSSSHYVSNHSESQTLECDDIKDVGSNKGIVIKSQFTEKHSLAMQILNMNVDKMAISKIKIIFHNNSVGVTSTLSDVSLPTDIKYNHGFGFVCHLSLDANKVDETLQFEDNIRFVVNTNLLEINCEVKIPIYLFFEARQELKPDNFLFLWKSVPNKERKLKLNKCKIQSISELKMLLSSDVYNLWFMYHRTLPKKGDILYYSCVIQNTVILIEVAVALQGRGTVITRSYDEYKSMLCAKFIQSLLDICD